MANNKLTVLQMTQSILSSMDYDTVNSINNTPESLAVANTIMEVYYNILRRKEWGFLKLVTQLQNVSDINQPTKIQIPDLLSKVNEIYYDKRISSDSNTTHRFTLLTYLEPQDFLNLTNGRIVDNSTIFQYNTDNGIPLFIKNNVPPEYWTSFDDINIYMDAWDSAQTSTVIASYTQVIGAQEPQFILVDTFVPVLPNNMFSLLLEESRSTCSARFRQLRDVDADKEALKQYNAGRLNEHRMDGRKNFKNFGRLRVR